MRNSLTFLATLASICVSSIAIAQEAPCENTEFEGHSLTVCRADPATEDIRLWYATPDGVPVGTFTRLRNLANAENGSLIWAMNGGMFHDDLSPVGYYRDPMGEARGLVTRAGPGNFGMLPNGVLCLSDDKAEIIESLTFDQRRPECTYATQSGPMLVIDGKLHERFIPGSDSRFLRNGVGVTPEGELVAVISNQVINFHDFARYFRDVLQTPNALYLDGKVSRLYAPSLNRGDIGFPVGQFLGVVSPGD